MADYVSDEELYSIIEILLIYYSAINKQLTEEEILRKIRKLERKGGKIMTILQEREMKGIEKGKLESGDLGGLTPNNSNSKQLVLFTNQSGSDIISDPDCLFWK